MADDEQYDKCYFPDINVERIGNVVLLHCDTEDDAVIAYEIFKEIAIGKSICIGKADAE